LDIIEHHREGKNFESYIKYEVMIAKHGWTVFLVLFIEDLLARIYLDSQDFVAPLIFVQILFFALFYGVNLMKLALSKKGKEVPKYAFTVAKILEIVIVAAFVSTMYHSPFFYSVALLPIAFICMSRGFKNTTPYILIGLAAQMGNQLMTLLLFRNTGIKLLDARFLLYFIVIAAQYLLFTVFCHVWSIVYEEYLRSEEENNILIDRLGDKYVQLEQVKKEIQAHYDKIRETNSQLEEANNKLTASVAEFFTLQQISQAITSIFDMNELLKFVNDVIIGVMGVYHSTIALCYGPHNKLKVQVSSIFDKKDLAIVSDYINSDVLKPSTEEGRSMIDNAVNPDDYPFTKGRDIQSMICVPLLAKGKTLGIVLIEHNMKDAFDSENVRLLEIIAQQVSTAIENARLYQQMHDLATLDGLTGAYNRLYFQDKLMEEFKKAQDKGYDLSFIIFDIDHFKKFNDTYGHLFGDQVLKSISAFITKTLRKEDIFARYGGEEFVILMPHTTLEQAREKAEDLRQGISMLTVTDRVVSASVTVSIGVSSFPQTAGRPTELVKTADDALYAAKNGGRNQVCVAQPRDNK
jgi:diguanylate cyclase (GGDEF)-like protein